MSSRSWDFVYSGFLAVMSLVYLLLFSVETSYIAKVLYFIVACIWNYGSIKKVYELINQKENNT